MVDSLEHRRPLVNGYSGQRPSFFSGAVDAMAAFPSIESMWMLKDLDVRFVVVAPVEDVAMAARRTRRLPDPVRGTRWIYELAWSPEVEARLGEPTTPMPPEPGAMPFHGRAPGLRVTGMAHWNRDAGTVVLAVDSALANRRYRARPDGYRFSVTARTAPWIARFFEADDRFMTTTDARLFPQCQARAARRAARGGPAHPLRRQRLQAQPLVGGGAPPGRPCACGRTYGTGVRLLLRADAEPSPGSRVEVPIVENGRHSTLELA